jgi:MFS family permease
VAVTNVWTFFGTLVVWAVGAALLEPTLMSLLASRAPTAERGAVMGLGDAINGVALVLAPLAGSGIIGANPRLLGILPACAMLGALWFGRRPRSLNDSPERTKPRL